MYTIKTVSKWLTPTITLKNSKKLQKKIWKLATIFTKSFTLKKLWRVKVKPHRKKKRTKIKHIRIVILRTIFYHWIYTCSKYSKIRTYTRRTISIWSFTQKKPQMELPSPHKPPSKSATLARKNILKILKTYTLRICVKVNIPNTKLK